jgi:hypothetical protein
MTFPLLALVPVVEKVFDRIFPDKQQAAEAKLKLIELQQSGELAQLASHTEIAKGQLAINAEEAKSADPFTRRARPFIMWVCGVAFAYHFIAQPFLAFIFAVAGYKIDLPYFDMDSLNTVLMGLLGLGGMRSVEKVKGVAK